MFDNASGEHWGLFVLGRFENSSQGRAYNPDGTVRIPSFIRSFGGTCGLGMNREGTLYVGGGQFAGMFNPENGAPSRKSHHGEPMVRRRAVPQRLGSRKQQLASP